MKNKLVQSIKKEVANYEKFAKLHSPEIFVGMGLVQGLITIGETVRATVKSVKQVELVEKEKEKKLDSKETIQVIWKNYIPTAASFTLSTGLIIHGVGKSQRNVAALAAAYKLADEAATTYRDNVIKTIGANKEAKIREAVAEDELAKNPQSKNTVIVTGKGKSLCYDSLSGRYFLFDIDKIKETQNLMNEEMINYNYVSINTLYSYYGLEPIDLGYELGWSSDMGKLIELELDSKLTDQNEPCLVINYNPMPVTEYYNLYR